MRHNRKRAKYFPESKSGEACRKLRRNKKTRDKRVRGEEGEEGNDRRAMVWWRNHYVT